MAELVCTVTTSVVRCGTTKLICGPTRYLVCDDILTCGTVVEVHPRVWLIRVRVRVRVRVSVKG